MEVHCEEKMARAHSATIIIEEEARRIENAKALASTVSSAVSPEEPTRVENEATIYEGGQVYLKGNPLATTRAIICTRCRLPRLLDPTAGKGSVVPAPNQKYCARHPSIDKPGHDIWGQPFATDPISGNKAKKEKEKKKLQIQNSPEGSPPAINAETKAAVTFPSVKCPVCNRYFCVTRLTPHLEKCMAVNVRDASRKAKAKIELNHSSRNSSTPHGSRRGTPMPGNLPTSNGSGMRSPLDDDDEEEDDDEGDDDEDDDEDETPKKKRRRINKVTTKKVKPVVRKATDKEATSQAKKSKYPRPGVKPSHSPNPTASSDPRAASIPKSQDRYTDDDSDVVSAPKKKKKLVKLKGAIEDGPFSKIVKLKGTSNDAINASYGLGTKKQTADTAASRDSFNSRKSHTASPLSRAKPSPEKDKNGNIGGTAPKKRKLDDHQQIGKDDHGGQEDNDPFQKRSKKQHPTNTPTMPAVEV